MTLLEGFAAHDVDGVHAVVAGDGPPLLLLHGYPETHVMWHRVAPTLTRTHTVVVADLRGYGDSHRPAGPYSKRAMAAEQVALMGSLGFDRFDVAGHDRGARVTHRMCLDHPGVVGRAAVLDIVPTRHVFATADMQLGMAYYHWFFLAQPFDLPERLIGSDPEWWIRHHLAAWSRIPDAFDPDAVAEYVRCFDAASVHASCEDYRAAAGIDLTHDDADAGRLITCPLLVLYGARGFVGHKYDVDAVWREYAEDVRTEAIDCGHFLPEEAPEATTAALVRFFG
jgi:haloacetate dehalogenase